MGHTGGGVITDELSEFERLFANIAASEAGPLFAVYGCRPGEYHKRIDSDMLLAGRMDKMEGNSVRDTLRHFNTEANWKPMLDQLMGRCKKCCKKGRQVTMVFMFGNKTPLPTKEDILKETAKLGKQREGLQFASWPGVRNEAPPKPPKTPEE
jgi:hypothetical protein